MNDQTCGCWQSVMELLTALREEIGSDDSAAGVLAKSIHEIVAAHLVP